MNDWMQRVSRDAHAHDSPLPLTLTPIPARGLIVI